MNNGNIFLAFALSYSLASNLATAWWRAAFGLFTPMYFFPFPPRSGRQLSLTYAPTYAMDPWLPELMDSWLALMGLGTFGAWRPPMIGSPRFSAPALPSPRPATF